MTDEPKSVRIGAVPNYEPVTSAPQEIRDALPLRVSIKVLGCVAVKSHE